MFLRVIFLIRVYEDQEFFKYTYYILCILCLRKISINFWLIFPRKANLVFYYLMIRLRKILSSNYEKIVIYLIKKINIMNLNYIYFYYLLNNNTTLDIVMVINQFSIRANVTTLFLNAIHKNLCMCTIIIFITN